ncbi:hypothetical protein LUZ60_008793 [Juncus effusus]|nr:hypothetical protein LUZ60_008793 [Juncus effusus]
MGKNLLHLFFALLFLCFGKTNCSASPALEALRRSSTDSSAGLCDQLLLPFGYPCTEHTVETEDGFVLTVHRVPYGKNSVDQKPGPPVFLQHGLFQGGDTWFINPCEQSLGYILADNGFDVWVGNVRGTRYCQKHTSFTIHKKEFWDWSWQELAEYDLKAMLSYVNSVTNSKIIYIGHSQGTIMGLASFTMPEIISYLDSAALLCPISYLDHVTSRFVIRAVALHLDQILQTMGIHQLNFRSDMGIQILDSLCDEERIDCNNLLSSITGDNCCFNASRVDYYLEYEPHPSSTKNLRHLFQMIRKGTFAKYDYGILKNLKKYGQIDPPSFDLQNIPSSFPLWMGYGGLDELADIIDLNRTLSELKTEPELLYVENYGHIDFIMSTKASDDIYVDLNRFLKSRVGGLISSY